MERLFSHLVPERIFGFAADLYDEIAETARETYYKKIALEITDCFTEGRMLDLGTGPGYLPIEIVKLEIGVQIDAVDLSKKMIEIARRNAKEAGVSGRIHFHLGNANSLKFDDGAYDLVISTGAFHSWKRPAKVIDECHRILRPKGEAWIYDPAQISTEPSARQKLEGAMKWQHRIGLKLASATNRLPRRSLSEICEILNRTHFPQYQIYDRQGAVRIKLMKG